MADLNACIWYTMAIPIIGAIAMIIFVATKRG